MTEASGRIYDLGYLPYEGARYGRRGAITATIRDGVQRTLGIRRRARKKILPWILMGLAIIPATVFVGFSFLATSFSPDAESPFGGHAEYFMLTGTLLYLFVALAAPELLIPDRKEGVLAIYSSRPLRADDYIWARLGALAIVLAGFLLIPHVLMYIGFAGLSNQGLASGLIDNAGELPKILLASVGYVAAYAPIAMLIATFTSRKSIAAGVFVAGMPLLVGVGSAIVQASDLPGHRYGGLLALAQHPDVVKNWIFDSSGGGDLVPRTAGLDPWMSLAVIVVVLVACLTTMVLRYRRLM